MILNVGGRTDIVNHYGEWLMNRFRAGYVCVRNPLFPNKVTSYEIGPDKVDAVLFCSKNYAPFLDDAASIASSYRTYFHYTITGYGKDMEPNIPSAEQRIATLIRLSEAVGKEKVAWRYDPVFLTEKYTAEYHMHAFETLTRALAKHIDRCIFGFVDMQVRVAESRPWLKPITPHEKQTLAAGFGKIAAEYKMPIQVCRENGYPAYGVGGRGCVTLDILGKANGCSFREMKHRGNRRSCACIVSRDIGSYETCPNLCKYCYASTDAQKVAVNRLMHDVNSPLLVGNIKPTDIIFRGMQESYLKNDGSQLSLFDF